MEGLSRLQRRPLLAYLEFSGTSLLLAKIPNGQPDQAIVVSTDTPAAIYQTRGLPPSPVERLQGIKAIRWLGQGHATLQQSLIPQ